MFGYEISLYSVSLKEGLMLALGQQFLFHNTELSFFKYW